MARGRDTPKGNCRICGTYGPLTFEHVPPEAAFNCRAVTVARFEALRNLVPGGELRGPKSQRGAGEYSLCGSCNNFTGREYGTPFKEWTVAGMDVLMAARGEPRLLYPIRARPLRVLKQILSMFFSINGPQFRKGYPELVKFVLDLGARCLPPSYRFFTYFSADNQNRAIGIAGKLNGLTGETIIMTEVSFPPFGYLMTVDSGPPDPRLFEITDFARYGVDQVAEVTLGARRLPNVSIMPGDYRTLAEVQRTWEENQAAEMRRLQGIVEPPSRETERLVEQIQEMLKGL